MAQFTSRSVGLQKRKTENPPSRADVSEIIGAAPAFSEAAHQNIAAYLTPSKGFKQQDSAAASTEPR